MDANRLTINGQVLAYDDVSAESADRHGAGLRNDSIIRTERLESHPHAVTVTPALAGYADSFPEFTVADGQYFFLGDNRDRSRDSRFIGTVALDEIYGRVTHVALSVDPDRYYRPRFDRWLKPLDDDVE